MLARFGVTPPAGTKNLRFQVEDASSWNSGTQLILYLQFSMPEAEVAQFLAADDATPSSDLLMLGDVAQEMQLGPVWTAIAEQQYGRMWPFGWGDSTGGGAMLVDDGTGASDPTIYLTSGSTAY